MIRKVIIAVLTLAAVSTIVVGLISFAQPLYKSLTVKERAVQIEVSEGRYRLRSVRLVDRTMSPRHVRFAWPGFGFRFDRPYPVAGTELVEMIVAQAYLNILARYSPQGSLLATANLEVLHLSMPFWSPAFIFSVYPAIAFFRGPLRRYRRREKGCCLNCGYNLTGNLSRVCPECGTLK